MNRESFSEEVAPEPIHEKRKKSSHFEMGKPLCQRDQGWKCSETGKNLPGVYRQLKVASVAWETETRVVQEVNRPKSMGLGGSKKFGLPREMESS